MTRVLEANVDDRNTGGVFALVRNVIINNKSETIIDIAALEPFENQDNISLLKEHNCNVHYVGYSGNKLIKQLKIYHNVKSLLKKEKYDCVHIHSDVANKMLVSGLAAKHADNTSIILHSHSSGVEGRRQKMRIALHKCCRTMLQRIDAVRVACSDKAAEWMYNTSNNVVLINNGIPLIKYRYSEDSRKRVRKELSLNDELVIGHVGRFLVVKNHVFMIDILKELKQCGVNAKLVLVGEGDQMEAVKRKVEENGLQDDVIFYGTTDDVGSLLCAMDVFILPSFFEGFPIVGVEAQASGLPAVFSDAITRSADITGKVRFLPIGQEDSGKWAKAIIELKAGYCDNRESAFEVVKKQGFDIDDTVQRFLNLYKPRNRQKS